jgi:hypothetical protein
MSFIVPMLLAALTAPLAEGWHPFASVQDDGAASILGGTRMAAQDYAQRSTVGILAHRSPAGWCTGVVVASRFILTAAHCDNRSGDTVRFFASATASGETRQVDGVYYPTAVSPTSYFFPGGIDYSDESFVQDVALLHLRDPIPTGTAIAILPSVWDHPSVGTIGWQIGTGAHDNGATAAATDMRWAERSISEARSGYGSLKVGVGCDPGDSGGPFYVRPTPFDGRLKVLGITHGDADDNSFSLFTSLTDTRTREWIDGVLAPPKPNPGDPCDLSGPRSPRCPSPL